MESAVENSLLRPELERANRVTKGANAVANQILRRRTVPAEFDGFNILIVVELTVKKYPRDYA